jgi:hypothetical protein
MNFTRTLSFLLLATSAASGDTRVIITGGASLPTHEIIGVTLTEVMNEVNRVARGQGDLGNIKNAFSRGFDEFVALVNSTGMSTIADEIRIPLIVTETGKYEVRGLQVRVRMGDTIAEKESDLYQELVFLLNGRCFIENVNFALEKHHYRSKQFIGLDAEDRIHRRQILDFIEDFRTAHNRKDKIYLERAYSDDALIIVGRVLQNKENGDDFLQTSSLGAEKIQFIKLKKREYIERLEKAFEVNSFVRVTFEEIEVIRHRIYPEIYGVRLKQRWNSSTYSDEGYLFIMIDFKDQDRPLIHVRSWQPEPFSDGSLVGLNDFEIID